MYLYIADNADIPYHSAIILLFVSISDGTGQNIMDNKLKYGAKWHMDSTSLNSIFVGSHFSALYQLFSADEQNLNCIGLDWIIGPQSRSIVNSHLSLSFTCSTTVRMHHGGLNASQSVSEFRLQNIKITFPKSFSILARLSSKNLEVYLELTFFETNSLNGKLPWMGAGDVVPRYKMNLYNMYTS